MVDYSKWDNLDVSDDEAPAKPQVHRFDSPQTVTIGSGPPRDAARDGDEPMEPAAEEEDGDDPVEPDEDAEPSPGGDRREDVLQCRALGERALQRGDAAEGVRLLEKAMRLGGETCPGLAEALESARRMAGVGEAGSAAAPQQATMLPAAGVAELARVGERYAWCQTRDSVEVNVFVDRGTKAKDVAVEVSETRLCLKARGACLLEGDWEHKVAPEEDPDWELRPLEGKRVLRLTVRKAPLPGGMSIIVWWPRLLKGEPGIDVKKIEGRKLEASQSFADAWKQAHIEFKERVKTRKPVPVDLSKHAPEDDACDVDG